jgi:outer membrane protein TolC
VKAAFLTLWLVLVSSAASAPVLAQTQDYGPRVNTQTSAPPGSNGARSLGPFMSGVPSGERTGEPLSLSIADAINRALEHNLGVLLAEQAIQRAQGVRWRVLSDLLPSVSGQLAESRQVLNLAAYGFPLPAGIPSIVGPFNLFDARVSLSQSVLDLKALNDARAETHNLAAARHDRKDARDLVVLVATVSYAQVLAASARVEAAQAQVGTAQALFNQATDLKEGGLVAGIDVLRAEVELDAERQRATTARNEFEKSKLQLARLIGLPIGQVFNLTSQLSEVAIPEMTLDQALERAYRTRSDYLASLERVRAAEATRQAAIGERLPAVRVTANYGDLGTSIADSHSTYALAGAVDVPIFQGGKTRGRLLEAEADLRSRRADADELKAAIYYELRAAMLDLEAGNEQLQVAMRTRTLAASQLTQARDRFAAGVSGNIEVVQAQAAVTAANDQYIAALYTTSLAKGMLVRAIGIAEDTARELFGGIR